MRTNVTDIGIIEMNNQELLEHMKGIIELNVDKLQVSIDTNHQNLTEDIKALKINIDKLFDHNDANIAKIATLEANAASVQKELTEYKNSNSKKVDDINKKLLKWAVGLLIVFIGACVGVIIV